jgi:hypothetical protein
MYVLLDVLSPGTHNWYVTNVGVTSPRAPKPPIPHTAFTGHRQQLQWHHKSTAPIQGHQVEGPRQNPSLAIRLTFEQC